VRFGTQGGCRGGHEVRPQRCWAAWRLTPSGEPIPAHASITTTLDLYGHLYPGEMDRYADRLDEDDEK